MTTAISLHGVNKVFNAGMENEVRALKDVDLEISEGEFVGIIGPSGSGKSTLMHIIGALDAPSQGTVEVAGQVISDKKISKLYKIRAHKIGFVFQGFNLIPTMTALENVMLACKYAGKGKRSRALAERALKLVGLESRMHHFPNELSGGESQRVAIARALVNSPALVLADEPTGQLDTHTSGEVIGLMKRLCREHKQTFIIVTHNPEVARVCDRLIVLRDGEIIHPHHRHYPKHIHSVSTDNILLLPHAPKTALA
jgi:ABC-type lipoprotein export system ATPase subunit